ncbi:Hypothetical Protein XCAW_04130 [Xanthomonas citri subsp. citri Aw12879]|nr:Hypothetical Protein XCAW_04130 [Xanthomonas citri subsp. citri Aw12879]
MCEPGHIAHYAERQSQYPFGPTPQEAKSPGSSCCRGSEQAYYWRYSAPGVLYVRGFSFG